MNKNNFKYLIIVFLYCNTIYIRTNAQDCYPKGLLPNHIEVLTNFGQRAEWAIDGKSVYFLDRPGGDVWNIVLKTRKLSQITKKENRPAGFGYYRVMCLANGDLLLCGGYERHVLHFDILDKSLKKPLKRIENEMLDEGPAISRKSMKIAWTLPGQRQIMYGKLNYTKNKVHIIDKQLLVDSTIIIADYGKNYQDILESQNWKGENEMELIFAQYKRGKAFRAQVFGINLNTKSIINYSKAEDIYNEPEGIFPNQRFTLVESDLHKPTSGTSTIDIYKLELNGSGKNVRRLTFFSDIEGFRSSNPVISDDSRFMIFQGSKAGSEAGGGCGLYLFDLKKFEEN